MPDVFEVLSKDHNEVERMCRELENSPSVSTGATEEQLAQRKELVEQLIIEESKHEAVEEEYFWPSVRELVQGGDSLADTAIGQEDQAKHMLDQLRTMSADNVEFESLLTRLIADGREHIAYEENQVWPGMRKMLTPDRAAELGSKLEEGKKAAPTRPHPKTPAKPGVLKTAGAGAGLMDRVRDAVTRRGKH